VISPRSHVAKAYVADLARPLNGSETELFASGTLMLEGETKPLAAARLESLGESRARLTITEGRYHQVRRMFAAAGNPVTALHRESVGALALPAELESGAYRIATAEEVSALFA
jgi:16S rRNA pseudouridine516 synthase